VDNNQPGWRNIIETEPNVTLSIGTKLYLEAAAIPVPGAPFGGGFFAGVMTVDGCQYALVVAPKAEGENQALQFKVKDFGTADGVTSDDDGVANSNRINDADHPAAQFCRGLSIGGFTDWYLPSRDELMMLWRNLGPRRKNTPAAFREDGPEVFDTEGWYWSSTENASYSFFAWVVDFSSGTQGYFHKDNYYAVRAVRRLPI
jgi:hypothetical protein